MLVQDLALDPYRCLEGGDAQVDLFAGINLDPPSQAGQVSGRDAEGADSGMEPGEAEGTIWLGLAVG